MGFVADDQVEFAEAEFLRIGHHLNRLIGGENDGAAIRGHCTLAACVQLLGVGGGGIGQIVGADVFLVAADLAIRTDDKGMKRR